MKRLLKILLIFFVVTINRNIGADTYNYEEYRESLREIAGEYINALANFAPDNMTNTIVSFNEVLSVIENANMAGAGIIPQMKSDISAYISVIELLPVLNELIPTLYEANQTAENDNEYIDAYEIYKEVLEQAEQSNPFTGKPVSMVYVVPDFMDYVYQKKDNDMQGLYTVVNRSPSDKIKLFISPFFNRSGNINHDYITDSMVNSVITVLESFEVFEAHSVSTLGLSIDSIEENGLDYNLLQNNDISLVIEGEFNVEGDYITIIFSGKDILANKVFLNLERSSLLDYTIFETIDWISERLAYSLEMYAPETGEAVTDLDVITLTSAGYLAYLNTKMYDFKRQGTIHYISGANSVVPSSDQDKDFDVIEAAINKIMVELDVTEDSIIDWDADNYNIMMSNIMELLLIQGGTSRQEIEDFKSQGKIREAARAVDRAILYLENYNDVPDSEKTVIHEKSLELLETLKSEFVILDEQLKALWNNFNFGFSSLFGYTLPVADIGSYATVSPVPAGTLSFDVKLPLQLYHILPAFGFELNYQQTKLDSEFLQSGEFLQSNIVSLKAFSKFMWEPFWQFWFGLSVSTGLNIVTSKTDNSEAEMFVNNPAYMFVFAFGPRIEYQVYGGLFINLNLTMNILVSDETELLLIPRLGVSYMFL